MNRLIVEIEGKLNEGICGEPYKIVYRREQSKAPGSLNGPSKKLEILENYGELHLYKDSRLLASLNQDSELPLVRSTMVLVLGLSEASLDAVVSPLLKQKCDLIEIEILKDKNKRIYLIVVFRQLQASEEFFSRYQFRLMEDNSHLLCFFLKDEIYLTGADRDSSFDDVLLFGKVESDFREWIQLPTCMSCLEKIECRVSGINYNYTGEQELPSRANASCGLCYTLVNKDTPVKCSDCPEQKDLWGCLVCNQVGCGRYKQGHAEQHFMNKNHTLSIELSTERVWNYLGDSFVHRIIKSDNNILNFPEYDSDEHGKLESEQGLLWEYCTKISEELQKQRVSYTRRLKELEESHRGEERLLKEEIDRLQDKKKARLKEAEAVKARKAKLEQRKKELREDIAQQRELNKLLETQIKCTKQVENEIILNKRMQCKELEQRLDKMLSQIDFE